MLNTSHSYKEETSFVSNKSFSSNENVCPHDYISQHIALPATGKTHNCQRVVCFSKTNETLHRTVPPKMCGGHKLSHFPSCLTPTNLPPESESEQNQGPGRLLF